MIIAVFGLAGCVTSTNKSYSLAPAPPELRYLSIYKGSQAAEAALFLSESETRKEDISSLSLINVAIQAEKDAKKVAKAGLRKTPESKGCSMGSRFDRKAVLAYEWGQNRLGLDVDGINLSGGGERAIKVEYRLRLQPWKSKKEKCRYESNWQGLIGSGYNELFLREEDTVWEEFREIKKDVSAYIQEAF